MEEVSLRVAEGEAHALVGESGCGKSVTALSILRLIPSPPGEIVSGEILFEGQDLLKLSDERMRAVRGNRISMVFQEPMTSLNPVFTVGFQIEEVLRLHRGMGKKEAHDETVRLLDLVGIPSPALRVRDYPHRLSGGMRQRVMIAMALAGSPALLIADEPTTALDVTIQAQILDLLRRLMGEMGLTVLLITHNLGIVAQFVRFVTVMYAGRVVEESPVGALFAEPLHPYTTGLLGSVPVPGRVPPKSPLPAIPGQVPGPFTVRTGCRFADRCAHRFDRCGEEPPLITKEGRSVRCWLHA